MKALRTPDARFERLVDYPFEPNYVEVGDGLRMHYVDEGLRDAAPVLMLHGEPSWSYLYRKMIPIVAATAGLRVVAPDLIGFGRSDKPTSKSDYSYQSHMEWLGAFVEALDLSGITLVCQDWGSLLGLRYAAENPSRFARITVGNGMLPTGDIAPPKAFNYWKLFALYSPWFPIARIVNMGTRRDLTPEELRAYDAPFPSGGYKAGTRAFPRLVPTTPDDPASDANRRAWKALERWEKPFLTCFSSGDPIMRGGDGYLQKRIPGCKGQPHATLRGGHFLQEDSGPEWAERIVDWIASS